MEKSFEKKYSLNVARLKDGDHRDSFEIDSAFFEAFENPVVTEAELRIDLEIQKTDTHLDIRFHLHGQADLTCDRCLEPFSFGLDAENRIIYSFDESMDFKGYEVMYVDRQESHLSLVQELYDFISLSIPFRKVPDPSVHLCAPDVLDFLGLDEQGRPKVSFQPKEEQEIDPRWEALKKLKDQEKP